MAGQYFIVTGEGDWIEWGHLLCLIVLESSSCLGYCLGKPFECLSPRFLLLVGASWEGSDLLTPASSGSRSRLLKTVAAFT